MGLRVIKGGSFRVAYDGHDNAGRVALAEVNEAARTRIVEIINEAGRVDTGKTHQGIKSRPPRRTARGWEAVTESQPPIDVVALVIEKGRRPGKRWPPAAKIRTWVRRKLGNKVLATTRGAKVSLKNRATGKVTGVKKADADAALDRVTFLIRRKIGVKGTPAIQPFGRTATAWRNGRAKALFRAALQRLGMRPS